MQPPTPTPTLEQFASPAAIWRALRRHKVSAAAFFVAVLAVVGAATVLMPRTYRSQTKLFLRLGRENATLDPTATLGQNPVVALPQTRDSEINSVIEVIKNRVLLEKVVDRVGPGVILGKEPYQPGARPAADPNAAPSREIDDRYRAVVKLSEKIEAEAVKKSNIVQIGFEGPSPEVSQAVVSSLVEFYLEEHARINRTPGAHKFLAEQADRLRGELTRSEESLRALKEETGLVAPDAQRQILVDRVGRLENELAGIAATMVATEAEAKALREKIATLPATVIVGTTRGLPNQAADAMRAQLYTLQIKELELKAKYPENHPDLVLTRQQTAAAAAILAKEEAGRDQVTTGPNKAREEAELSVLRHEAALASNRARVAALERQLTDERERLKAFTANQFRVAKYQREVELHDAQYRRFAESLERSQIDLALELEKISNVSVVQPATFDVKPVRPNKLLNAAVGLVLAFAGAIAVAIFRETRSGRGSGSSVLASAAANGAVPEVVAARNGVHGHGT